MDNSTFELVDFTDVVDYHDDSFRQLGKLVSASNNSLTRKLINTGVPIKEAEANIFLLNILLLNQIYNDSE